MQKARDVMTPNPSVCLEGDSIHKATLIMKKEDCGAVPIINSEGKCTGIVTDRDICLGVVLDGKDPNTAKLHQVMTPSPVTCGADDDLDSVVKKMEDHQIRRIPVVDGSGKCLGIIAQADLALSAEEKEQVLEMVEAVSR